MGAVRFDRSRFPIVVVELEGKPTDRDLDEYLGGLGKLLDEKGQGVVVVDMTRAQPSEPAQRKRIGEWMKANRARLAEVGLGCAFVIPSAVFRFVLSSIFLIQRPPMPYTVVATVDEALVWARGQLAQRAQRAQRPTR